MKTKIFLSILAFGVIVSAIGQNTIELTFTAIESTDYEQLDSIKVMNSTQGGDTVLFYPDTVLLLNYQVGISETNTSLEGFQVFQNFPNPVHDHTSITFYVPKRDNVRLIVTDIFGRELFKHELILDQGYHTYSFTPGNGNLFLFTIQWRKNSSSIKILKNNSVSNSKSKLVYIGGDDLSSKLKSTVGIQNFQFSLDDTLLYIGYYNTLQSGMLDKPQESGDYTFQFATNIPCPGTPTLEYEGQVYNTIQIFNQCWLKENLNVGMMIGAHDDMEDNGIIEKYCYVTNPDSCTKYGGLYQWDEMMQYITTQGTKGICPPNWHIPTDQECKILAGHVDSQYPVGDPEWDDDGWRGYDAGERLKTQSGWYNNGNGTDLYSFSALPGGYHYYNGINGFFMGLGEDGSFWSSTEYDIDHMWRWYLTYSKSEVFRDDGGKNYGRSVRCVRD